MSIPNERFQHFLNFSTKKRKGVIRIGVFGNSYTFGAEVQKTETYPYQLQKLFNKQFPNKKIEILNFGKSGVGFQEQFFMWEKYGKKFKLDYFLLGPRGVYPRRDVTFCRNWDWNQFSYPKNRFILTKQNTLKQVFIQGDTWKERYRNYYKLIPSWTALCYDRKPFQIWEKFLPFLRNKITNPFYYKQMSNEEESSRINILLLKQIESLYNKKILFFIDNMSLFSNYKPVKKLLNLNYISFPKNRMYEVFNHKSSLGNEYIAKVYFNALLGRKNFFIKKIHCYFMDNKTFNGTLKKKLSAIQSIQITDGQTPIFTLRHNFSNHYHNNGTYTNHKIKNIKSFISFFSQSKFLQSPFYPVFIELKEGMKLYIQWKDGSKITLGTIKALDSYKKIFVFYTEYIEYKLIHESFGSIFVSDKMPSPLKEKIKNITKTPELFIENYKLGVLYSTSEKQSILRFFPTQNNTKSFLMMGAFSGYTREADFSEEFPLYLQYNIENRKSFQSVIPNWKCKKENKKLFLKLPNFEPLNL